MKNFLFLLKSFVMMVLLTVSFPVIFIIGVVFYFKYMSRIDAYR